MAVATKYEPGVEKVIKLGYSAIAEACVSLGVFALKLGEGQREWQQELTDLLPPALLSEIVEFGSSDGDYWSMPSNFFDMASFRPYSLEIARVKTLSADEIHEVIVEEFKSTYGSKFESTVHALEVVERDPLAWRDRVVDLLERFQPYFEPIWNEIEPAFARALVRVEQLRKTKPLYEWLPTLDSRISWDPIRSQFLTPGSIDNAFDFTPYSEFGIVPSYFASDHSWSYESLKQRKVGVLFYVPDARGGQKNSPGAYSQVPDGLIDEGGLAILEVLNKQPATTSELAKKVKISERTAANRLKKLEEAGLVRPLGNSKSGRYRKWQADKERLRETLHALELRLLD